MSQWRRPQDALWSLTEGMQNQRGGLPEATHRNSRAGGLSPSSQPRVAPCGCNGSCGLLFLQRDPAYLGSAVCVDGELMLRAQREKGALRAQGA